jgi:autotransporter passenger strand-loop-strand repeat protein
VQGSGHANSTTVSGANAFQIVNSGGFASNGVVESGDQINVSAGGVASDTLVSSGGTLSSATIAGGTIEIVSGGTAGSSTITISSGTLVLDAAETFSGSVAGLATSGVQNVDLVDINFATLTLGYSGNTLSGVLSASDGVHTALLNMIGNYTPANFNTKAADDGHGGALITDPPLDAPVPSANLASLHSWGSDRRRPIAEGGSWPWSFRPHSFSPALPPRRPARLRPSSLRRLSAIPSPSRACAADSSSPCTSRAPSPPATG